MNTELDLKDLQSWLKDKCNKIFTISKLNTLEKLDISHCFLNVLHPDISLLPNLQYLYCSDNQLKEITLNCPNLHVIDCSHNQLKELTLNCPSLIYIYCYNNQFLIKMDDPILEIFKKFKFNEYQVYEDTSITGLI